MVEAQLNGADAAVRLNGSDEKTSAIGIQLTGTFSGTVVVEGSNDASTWVALAMSPWGGGADVTSVTAPGGWRVNSSGLRLVRIRISAYTSGTVNVYALPVVNG